MPPSDLRFPSDPVTRPTIISGAEKGDHITQRTQSSPGMQRPALNHTAQNSQNYDQPSQYRPQYVQQTPRPSQTVSHVQLPNDITSQQGPAHANPGLPQVIGSNTAHTVTPGVPPHYPSNVGTPGTAQTVQGIAPSSNPQHSGPPSSAPQGSQILEHNGAQARSTGSSLPPPQANTSMQSGHQLTLRNNSPQSMGQYGSQYGGGGQYGGQYGGGQYGGQYGGGQYGGMNSQGMHPNQSAMGYPPHSQPQQHQQEVGVVEAGLTRICQSLICLSTLTGLDGDIIDHVFLGAGSILSGTRNAVVSIFGQKQPQRASQPRVVRGNSQVQNHAVHWLFCLAVYFFIHRSMNLFGRNGFNRGLLQKMLGALNRLNLVQYYRQRGGPVLRSTGRRQIKNTFNPSGSDWASAFNTSR